MTAKSLSLAALLFAATTSTAIAQEETPNPPVEDFEIYEFEFNIIDDILNQPVYAPFRQESTVKESTRPAYVIDREQIEAQGYRTVNEALKYFPGVFIDSTAGTRLGAQSSQIIRGGNSSSQTLILLDGRPLNNFNTGAFDLSNLTTNNVERIELIPGGSSTLFGSNAIAGVINIVTRQPELNSGLTTEVGADLGTLGFNEQNIAISYGGEKAAVRIAYDRTDADNDYDYDISRLGLSGTRQNAESEIQNLNFQALGNLGDRHKVRFNGLYTTKDLGIPSGVNFPTLAQSAEAENWLLSLELESRLGNSDDSTLLARIFADFVNASDENPAGFFPFKSERENTSLGAQVQHNWQFNPNQNITYGLDYRVADTVAKNFGAVTYDDELIQGAIFANYAIDINPELTTTLGLRQDFNSLADGSFTSPSAGLRWQAGENTTVRANYARNFRAPTALDLYFPGFSNPDLTPEISNSFDIGFDQRFGRNALFRVTYFNNTIDDAIVTDSTFTPFNLGKIRNQGLETELTVQLSPTVYAFANYTMNNSKILEDTNLAIINNEVRFAGTDFFNVGLAYESQKGAYVGLFVKRVGDRLTNNSNTSSLEAYTNIDLRARYPINENVNVTASWENIFDEDYEVFNAYPGVGSRFQIGVNAKLR